MRSLPDEACLITWRLEFYCVPKHASWLNMVELEIGVLKHQCLDRRIEGQDNAEGALAKSYSMPAARASGAPEQFRSPVRWCLAYPRPR